MNKLELSVRLRLTLAEEVETSAMFVDSDMLLIDVSVDHEAGFARRISNTFDATSWPTPSPAAMVSPQLEGDLRDHSRTADPVDFAETAIVVMLVELKALVLVESVAILD